MIIEMTTDGRTLNVFENDNEMCAYFANGNRYNDFINCQNLTGKDVFKLSVPVSILVEEDGIEKLVHTVETYNSVRTKYLLKDNVKINLKDYSEAIKNCKFKINNTKWELNKWRELWANHSMGRTHTKYERHRYCNSINKREVNAIGIIDIDDEIDEDIMSVSIPANLKIKQRKRHIDCDFTHTLSENNWKEHKIKNQYMMHKPKGHNYCESISKTNFYDALYEDDYYDDILFEYEDQEFESNLDGSYYIDYDSNSLEKAI